MQDDLVRRMKSDDYFEHDHIDLAYMASLRKDLSDITFVSCKLDGPTILVLQGEADLNDSTIRGDIDALLWVIPPDRKSVIGAVLAKDTVFKDCVFSAVGFAGYSEFIEQLREDLRMTPAT